MSSANFTQLSSRIKHLRTLYSFSQKDLAQRLGVTDSYISQLESGAKTTISEQLFKLICHEFDISVDWLATGRGPLHGADRVADPGVEYGQDTVTRQLIHIMRRVGADGRASILEYAEFILKKTKG